MTLSGRTVLILEDEVIVAFALEDMLLDLGASVLLASTIEQGFACAEDEEIALAVLDVNVNGVKSYAFAEHMRQRGVPIIFATGYGEAEHPPRFTGAPTLTKPYTRLQLDHAVKSLV